MFELLQQPWPWYVAGPLIGLTVPALLLVGNKALGISSALRHVCAACVPAGIQFLTYNWRAEIWNLVFVLGIALGGFIGYRLMGHPDVVGISAATVRDLKAEMHLTDFTGLLPRELFALDNLANWKGWVFLVLGGFLVGFGTRYAGGCTSGHAISGLSNLQWVSLVAVIGFFAGGLLMTWVIYPLMF
ncbi:YeeE/YedE family protein [Hymenobacter sp. 5317J-9]|uniref:YeeE/YedE family protein n=1 Tax=Hymenobacter sp. 5317J-9 TaxID=2932250 RepID=UPI001FD6E000|nr:YeeE/YedE thiosulfate transporter family protein [Hymenobacter sp. 5317J-9]UOQ96662.1 YeeE/YedE family protein [Hymenobacter sp. 5317J-9]